MRRIRIAGEGDAEAVLRLIIRTVDTSYSHVYSPRALAAFHRYHAPHRVADRIASGSVVVVEEAGEVVATGALVGSEVFAVFVSPDRQGEGLGAVVMDTLEERARAAGHARITLDSSLPATQFYVHRGYTLHDRASLDVGEGETLDYYPADKLLT